jgi:hypothetical protein
MQSLLAHTSAACIHPQPTLSLAPSAQTQGCACGGGLWQTKKAVPVPGGWLWSVDVPCHGVYCWTGYETTQGRTRSPAAGCRHRRRQFCELFRVRTSNFALRLRIFILCVLQYFFYIHYQNGYYFQQGKVCLSKKLKQLPQLLHNLFFIAVRYVHFQLSGPRRTTHSTAVLYYTQHSTRLYRVTLHT